jgi:hypothetical protein
MHAPRSTARVFPFARLLLPAVAGLLVAAACSNTSAMLEPAGAAFAAPGSEVMFNPQPDPPLESHRFLINIPADSAAWRGAYVQGPRGVDSFVVRNLAAPVRRGESLHLRQSWSLPADTAGAPAVPMDGILNLRSGRLVLNGRTADGRTAHILAMPVDSVFNATHAGQLTLTVPVDSAAGGAPPRRGTRNR